MKVICFDLDDTLFKEIEFLKSAYREIATYAVHIAGLDSEFADKAYNLMFNAFLEGGNAFAALNEFLSLSVDIQEYLTIYRNHMPEIQLDSDTEKSLEVLRASGVMLGLITDGRSIQQRSKILALGLGRYFDSENIVISEEFGSEKPSLANYEYFNLKYPECKDFTYVGDNPKKDFITPNVLGWKTVCLLDNGCNIHKQNFSLDDSYLPKYRIKNLSDLLDLI